VTHWKRTDGLINARLDASIDGKFAALIRLSSMGDGLPASPLLRAKGIQRDPSLHGAPARLYSPISETASCASQKVSREVYEITDFYKFWEKAGFRNGVLEAEGYAAARRPRRLHQIESVSIASHHRHITLREKIAQVHQNFHVSRKETGGIGCRMQRFK
jgi:hypothetical protein